MSISPHASEALVHRHVLLRDLPRCALAMVILASHEIDWMYRKRGGLLQSFARAEKCKGTTTVVSIDVFEAGTLGWYLKPQSEEVDASGHAKGNHNL